MENLAWTPVDALINMMMASIVYVPAFVIGCLAAAFWAPRTGRGYRCRFVRLLTFFVVLLLVGASYSSVWGNTIWGWLYRSTDYCGCDFFPFLPIGQGAIDQPFGNEPHGLYHGATLFDLQILWFFFAAAAWATTIWLHRALMRKFFVKRGPAGSRIENSTARN